MNNPALNLDDNTFYARISEAAQESIFKAKKLTAPRVTPEIVDQTIKSIKYVQPEGTTMTTCYLTLQNDWVVSADSACASPENFDPEEGRRIAFNRARDQIWQLEGYVLKTQLHEATRTVYQTARLCHEVNRAYSALFNDFSHAPWEDTPEAIQESAINGVLFAVASKDATPESMHKSWCDNKKAEGWRYGPSKDTNAKTHPCLRSFASLPVQQQMKDAIFLAVVRASIPDANGV